MKLRIISGALRRRTITVPDSHAEVGFRATLERTRQSVAEIIKNRIPGALCVDVCAGSGVFGFEMISRGASRVDFVENNRHRAASIRQNADLLGITLQCTIVQKDIAQFSKTSPGGYDIIYYDPPYDRQDLREFVSDLVKLLADDGVLVYERRRMKANCGDSESDMKIAPFDMRTFGDTVIEFYMSAAAEK